MSERLSDSIRDDRAMTPSATLRVEVIADFVCPFCFIGKRRLDAALGAVLGPTEVAWYPFQLNPDMPTEGVTFEAYLAERFGGREKIQPVLDQLTAEGRSTGIDFRFDRIQHVPNTLPIHQVMHRAGGRGLDQSALADDLLRAFFESGRNIGQRDELVAIAARHGMSADEVDAALASDTIRRVVLDREAKARASGLSGVPGYLVNRRLLLVGAQTTEAFIAAFDQAMFGDSGDGGSSPTLH